MKQYNNPTIDATHFESLYPADARREQIGQLLTFVKEGAFCQVVSLPGVGRSNFLRLLQYNTAVRTKHLGDNQKWFHFVAVDFSEIRHKPQIDATKLLFLALLESLRERNLTKEHERTASLFQEALVANDELVLFSGLKHAIDLLAIEKELTIVFLFDRFEEYVPMLTQSFFVNLRTLSNRAKYRFSVVFSLTHPLENLVDPAMLTDIYSLLEGHTIYLPLSDDTAVSFRLSYLEKVLAKSIDGKVKQEIIGLTGGHEKMTRIAVEEVLGDSGVTSLPRMTVRDFLFANKAVRSVSYEIWNSLLPQEQETLKTLSKETIKQSNNYSYLVNIGLIKDDRITIPLFASFVAYRASQKEIAKITKAPSGEIKKSGDLISDTLTKSEYQLLSYFIEHEGAVIDREAVIAAVWQDAKSTAGVTDQALDQLIFRLRKKIEDDPNAPIHIQTIKGRGIKFLS